LFSSNTPEKKKRRGEKKGGGKGGRSAFDLDKARVHAMGTIVLPFLAA